MPRDSKILVRRDTAANWTSVNPTLASGEIGYETDTKKMKLGDGTTAWTSLGYFVTDASTSIKGIVQLTDSTSSTSTTTAATPNAVKSAYDLAGTKAAVGSATPSALGSAAAGTATAASHEDHVHPTTGLAVLASTNSFTANQTITGTGTAGSLIVNTGVVGNVGLIVRGASSQTADLQQWQNSAGTVNAKVYANGAIGSSAGFYNSANTGGYIDTTTNQMTVIQRVAGTVAFAVRGASSQTADLQQWQNSAGTVLASINADGSLRMGQQAIWARYFVNTGNAGSYIDAETVTNTISVIQRTTTAVGMIVKGAASQTADLQQWQNSAGTTIGRFTSSGVMVASGAVYSAAYQGVNGVGGAIVFANATPITVTPQSASVQSLVVKGLASQTANLQEWQNSSATVLAKVDATGNAQFTSIDGGTA